MARLGLAVLALLLLACSAPAAGTMAGQNIFDEISIEIFGLSALGAHYDYAAWIVFEDFVFSAGRFDISAGVTTYTAVLDYSNSQFALEDALSWFITIEDVNTPHGSQPSDVRVLAGTFVPDTSTVSGNSILRAHLAVFDEGAIDEDFSFILGTYGLQNYHGAQFDNGIWFVNYREDPLVPGLTIPDAPNGFEYEAWVQDGTLAPVSVGKFSGPNGADSDGSGDPDIAGLDFPGSVRVPRSSSLSVRVCVRLCVIPCAGSLISIWS